jgi:hypothetical protein
VNLTIPDTREAKFDLVFEMAARASELLPPVYVISHKRAGDVPTLRTIPFLNGHAKVVVAESEALDYSVEHPDADIMVIPSGYRGLDIGIGRAKQFVLDTADMMGQQHILLMDDDLESLTILYGIGGTKVSRAYAGHVADRKADFYLGLLVLFSQVMEEAYAENPAALTGSPQRNNANRTWTSSIARWETNRGVHPSQLQSWRVDRYLTACPDGMDLERFNLHGEDIALALQMLHAGGDLITVPSIVGQYRDYETQSTLRTPDTAPALRQKEHDDLQSHPLWPYVRTREDVLGRPQWHAVDWRKLKKDRDIREDKVFWID